MADKAYDANWSAPTEWSGCTGSASTVSALGAGALKGRESLGFQLYYLTISFMRSAHASSARPFSSA